MKRNLYTPLWGIRREVASRDLVPARVMRASDDAPRRAKAPEVHFFSLPSLAFVGFKGWGAERVHLSVWT